MLLYKQKNGAWAGMKERFHVERRLGAPGCTPLEDCEKGRHTPRKEKDQ